MEPETQANAADQIVLDQKMNQNLIHYLSEKYIYLIYVSNDCD